MPDQDVGLMAHLLRRAGFGASRDEIEAKAAEGYEATVEALLNPGSCYHRCEAALCVSKGKP